MQLEPDDVQRLADPAKVAIWVGLGAALLKGLHLTWRWIAKRIVMPVLYEVAREAMAEDRKEAKAVAELTRANASLLQRTLLEWEAAVRKIDQIADTVEDHHTHLAVLSSFLDVPMPDRRTRSRRASDRGAP